MPSVHGSVNRANLIINRAVLPRGEQQQHRCSRGAVNLVAEGEGVYAGFGGGRNHVMHRRSRVVIDPRIPKTRREVWP